MHMHPIFNHQISDPAMAPDVSLGPTIGLLHLQPPPTQTLSRWGSGDWKPWPIETDDFPIKTSIYFGDFP